MTEEATLGALGKRASNIPMDEGHSLARGRKTLTIEISDTETNDSEKEIEVTTPKTPQTLADAPALDMSDWMQAWRARQWTSGKPAPIIDSPTKVILSRGNNPITVAAGVIRKRTELLAAQRTEPKIDVDFSKYTGLLVLDCDKTILSNNIKEKKTTYRQGLSGIFQMCAKKKIQICLMSTAQKSTLLNYKKLLDEKYGIKIDHAFGGEDHAAGVYGIALNGDLFKIKILSHFFTEATLKRTIFLDDMFCQVCLNPENSFLVTEFYADVEKQDFQLVYLLSVLRSIFSREGDLRPIVSKKNGMMPLINEITESLMIAL